MTTNHAKVIRKALFHSNLPIFIYEAAITALDDITRELDAEIEEGERLNRAMCEQQATIAAEAERIKALEEALLNLRANFCAMSNQTPILESWINAVDAALTPKEAQ